MILRNRYDGGTSPLEGDRELVLRHLPSDARVVHARATVTPVDPGAGGEPFVETLAFRENLGDWGATKSASTAGGWVEVDFHARRTVVGLSGQLGTPAQSPAVQADLGGGFVPIGSQGTFLIPPQQALTVQGSSAVVPSLMAARLRLFGSPNQALDVTSVRVRSVPSGVRLALRGQPSFWFHAGELTRPETTPDFGLLLQAWLDDVGEAADGVWLLPFILHSDALGRLAVDLEIEYLRRATVLPGGLQDAALSFDHGGLPRSGGALLAALPGDARVARGSGRVAGAFEATRVAFPEVLEEVTPLGALTVAPGSSPAHPVVLPKPVEAVAVDLLLSAITRSARLQLDLRLNLDGKPAGESILPAPVPFSLDREMAGSATWISVPLAAPLQLRPGQEKTYWLVVQSLEGEAAWSVEAPKGTLPGMQLTQDGGFSWRQATLPEGPVSGLFRLRTLPGSFTMPIELLVGTGDGERRVSLARFAPQGRVDLSLDIAEVATAFNEVLASAPGGCPDAEHLLNGGFDEWTRTGSELGEGSNIELQGADDIPFDSARLAVTPDGRTALVASSRNDAEVALRIVDLDQEEVASVVLAELAGTPIAGLVADPGGTRAWIALSGSNGGWLWTVDLASRRSVGDPLPLLPPNQTSFAGMQATALAASPDGGTLYVAFSSTQTGTSGGGRVIALDARRLEEAALRGEPDVSTAGTGHVDFNVTSPVALAVSPDGAWLLVLGATLGSPPLAEVVPVKTATLQAVVAQSLVLGAFTPRSVAFTPDGRLVALLDDRVVVAGTGEATVTAKQAALAVDPDGSRLFLAGQEGLTVVDPRRRTAAPPLNLRGLASDVAVTPGGDRVLALVPSIATLVSIPMGTALPVAWTVTAGRVRRAALPGRGPVAFLGEIGQQGDRMNPAPVATAAVSQVVPVTAGCTYELFFQGIATERDAVAEVIWKAGNCGVARTDSVAITPIDERAAQARGLASLPLHLHRGRLPAPEGATQAEVRFRAPAGVAAWVDGASFRGTAASVLNGELTGEGLPEPWQLAPEGAPGFAVLTRPDGPRLRNSGAREAAISQEIELGEGRDFLLEIQARSVPVSARQAARAEIRWLTLDGAEAGPAVSRELPLEGFDALSARGTAPEGALRAQLRLAVPAGMAVDVRRLDLRFPEPAQVPVTFVAQAPGDLAVLGWELLYDQVPAPRPTLPAEGLCAPEPPPLVAGEKPADEDGCCHGEKAPAAPGMAPALAPFQRRTALSAAPVTAIRGIGKGRSRQLREAGMDSIETLAASSPGTLRRVLRGISEKAAVGVILEARDKLRARP
ncbi:MAG TPA: helix-hairpin-helix domain-containing protein [Thermoanaerobaculia bacterium]|nr:helix-hairpin-helix domain-containing protein [Thermoanaerobaculia bacterium]